MKIISIEMTVEQFGVLFSNEKTASDINKIEVLEIVNNAVKNGAYIVINNGSGSSYRFVITNGEPGWIKISE